MGNVTHSFDDVVIAQWARRRAIQGDRMTVAEAYEIAAQQLAKRDPVGHKAGYFIDVNNRLKRIKNSIPKEHRSESNSEGGDDAQ